MMGHLKKRGKVYCPYPFIRLRTLWLNYFSVSKKWLIFVSKDDYRP